MTDDDSRTVADVTHSKCWTAALDALGIDPVMTVDQFRRRLAMGERAEQLTRLTRQPEYDRSGYVQGFADGLNYAVDYIRGGPGA